MEDLIAIQTMIGRDVLKALVREVMREEAGAPAQSNGARAALSGKKCAEALGISLSALRRLRTKKKIKCVRIGRRVVYPMDGVEKFLSEHSE